MVSKWLERKIEDIILGLAPIPYADREIIEIAEGLLGIEGIPGLPPLHLSELSTGKKILFVIFAAVPVLDLEYLDLFGLDPFKSAEGGFRDTPELEGASFDRTGGGRGRPMTDGGRSRGGGGGSTMDTVMSVGGKALKAVLMIGLLLIPLVLIGGAMGVLGDSGYGAIIQQEVGLQITGLDLEDEFRMVQQGVQTVQCFGNAACMRQWRFNNTRRPGSEEVGESYKLQIDDFSVNDGYTMDISGREPSYTIPIDFSVYNPRHGLKGIKARGVQYRVRIDGGIFRSGDQAYCESGWEKLGGEFAGEFEGAQRGTILPGGFATPIKSLENINLEKCQLLQPGLGVSRNVVLEVKYNYSSQATLYFEAMSWENMRSLNERPSFKKSETADTPVQTYVNVESPVYYREDDSGDRFPSVFRVQMGVSTDENDLKYRVDPDDMVLYDSSATVDVNNAPNRYSNVRGDCSLDYQGDNEYRLTRESKEVIDHRQNDSWFTSTSGPSPVTCSMILENPDQISRSGETLTMRVDANYTVKLEESIGSFRVQNTDCERFNCPLLVALSQNEDVNYNTGYEIGTNDYKYMSTCDSRVHPDSANGCEVRDLSKPEPWKYPGKLNQDDVDNKIENGETALLWEEDIVKNVGDKFLFNDGIMAGAVGLEWENYDKVREDDPAAIIQYKPKDEGADVEFKEIEAILCKENSNRNHVTKMKDYWLDLGRADENNAKAVYFRPKIESCKTNGGIWDAIGDFLTGGDKFQNAKSECDNQNGILVVDDSTLECWA